MGKLDDSDHSDVRAEMIRDAARVLEEIDEVANDQALEAFIEDQVQARRSGAAGAACPGCGHDNPVAASFCDGCGIGLGTACSACGGAVRSGASFCGACGKKL